MSVAKISSTKEVLITCSSNGKNIKIWNAKNGDKLYGDFVRGSKPSFVSDICIFIDMKDQYIGCASESGKMHIFRISDLKQSYLQSARSFCSMILDPIHSRCKITIQDNKVIAVSQTGEMFQGMIPTEGSEVVLLKQEKFERI